MPDHLLHSLLDLLLQLLLDSLLHLLHLLGGLLGRLRLLRLWLGLSVDHRRRGQCHLGVGVGGHVIVEFGLALEALPAVLTVVVWPDLDAQLFGVFGPPMLVEGLLDVGLVVAHVTGVVVDSTVALFMTGKMKQDSNAHLNRDKIEYYLSAPGMCRMPSIRVLK